MVLWYSIALQFDRQFMPHVRCNKEKHMQITEENLIYRADNHRQSGGDDPAVSCESTDPRSVFESHCKVMH